MKIGEKKIEKVLEFLSVLLELLSIGWGKGAIFFANILSKRSDELIWAEDEIAKKDNRWRE